jgi:hypothetical protein
MAFAIKVNRTLHSVDVDGDTPLLWILRNVMGMTGTNATAGRATDGRWLTLRALSGFGRVFCLRVFPQALASCGADPRSPAPGISDQPAHSHPTRRNRQYSAAHATRITPITVT